MKEVIDTFPSSSQERKMSLMESNRYIQRFIPLI